MSKIATLYEKMRDGSTFTSHGLMYCIKKSKPIMEKEKEGKEEKEKKEFRHS